MAVEGKRGCGYRKVGGIYLMSGGLSLPCDRLPFPLTVCPTCSAGIKQSRGWTWVNLAVLTDGEHDGCADYRGCVMCEGRVEKAGLLWVGERFYKTPADFQREADGMGISRRISTVPHGLKLGETWVLLAHPKAIFLPATDEVTGDDYKPGIFLAFKPERIEVLVTEGQSKDEDYMAKLSKRGLTSVIVPDNDKDHQGTVYDDEENGDGETVEDAPLAELVQ